MPSPDSAERPPWRFDSKELVRGRGWKDRFAPSRLKDKALTHPTNCLMAGSNSLPSKNAR